MNFKRTINITLCAALLISSLSFNFSLQGTKKNASLEKLIELVQEPSFNEHAIKKADLKEFRRVVNYTDTQGFTPLHYATTARATRFLLDLGANPNIATEEASLLTPLHVASNKAVTKALISGGAQVDALDNDSRTPLFYAETGGAARILIEHGAQVNHKDNRRRTPIFYAKIAPVIQVLLDNGAKTTHKDTAGLLCIHYVQTREQAKALKQAGLSLKYEDAENNTLLHVVREARQARFLLQNGAHTSAANKQGETPLHCAVRNNRLSVIKLFLQEIEKEKDALQLLFLRTSKGENIFHLLQSFKAAALLLNFMSKNHLRAEKLLNEYDVKKTRPTPLAKLAQRAQSSATPGEVHKDILKIIRVLVHNGARIHNFNPEETRTAQQAFYNGLIAACLTGDTERADMLLERYKARKKQWLINKRFCGFTPLEAGLLQQNSPIVQLLVQHGARISPLLRPQVEELLSITPEKPVFIERASNNRELSSKAWLSL